MKKPKLKKNLPQGSKLKRKAYSIEDYFIEYVSWGYDPDSFWELTPKYFFLLQKASTRKSENEYEFGVTMAWISGVVASSSKPPKLNDLLNKNDDITNEEIEKDKLLFGLNLISATLPSMSWEEWQRQL